jgi:hypothetical protein
MIKILSNNTIYDVSTGIMYKRTNEGIMFITDVGGREDYFMQSLEESETLWSYLIEVGI